MAAPKDAGAKTGTTGQGRVMAVLASVLFRERGRGALRQTAVESQKQRILRDERMSALKASHLMGRTKPANIELNSSAVRPET